MVYTDINNTQLEAMLPTEHVDATTALREVYHLLPSDLTGRNADTLALYAMIGSQQQMARMCQRRSQRLLNQTNLHCQFLQPAQRTLGFVQVVNFHLYRRTQRLVQRMYIKLPHTSSLLTLNAIPLTMRITSSAHAAIYWFIHPCKSVNLRWMAFSLTPPRPISFVTKI